jgi:hypothetical protein
MVVENAFKAESGMVGTVGGAAVAGKTPVRVTSRVSIDNTVKGLYSFIKYFPPIMQSMDHLIDNMNTSQ